MKLFTWVILLISTASWGKNYQPEVLEHVLHHVQEVSSEGQKPILVFDLDDTLINTRYRTQRILQEMATDLPLGEKFPWETQLLKTCQPENLLYELEDTLKGIGIADGRFISEATLFWAARYFSSSYVAQDLPIQAAVNYVRKAHQLGATIVYLTGRDTPRMGIGTSYNLKHLGFPIEVERTHLIMKPKKEMDDLEFKKSLLDQITHMGVVVAGYENEPANINLFRNAWPRASMIFVDSIHSKKPDVPANDVIWIKDFNF